MLYRVLVLSQAFNATVPLLAVLAALGDLNLDAHADSFATYIRDKIIEDQVPMHSLVKLLRDAGVPPARAVAVKHAVNIIPASLVWCAPVIEQSSRF